MVEEFIYLGTTLTSQNYVQEEIKSSLKSRNVCYHSVQNPLCASLLSKNLKIKVHIQTYKFACCLVWVYKIETIEEHKLGVYESRVLGGILGGKRDGVRGGGVRVKELRNEELIDLYPSSKIIQLIKLKRMRWEGHVARMGDRRGVYRN
jgi:hypothetical protein